MTSLRARRRAAALRPHAFRPSAGAVAGLLLALSVWCCAATSAIAAEAEVRIANFTFAPATLKVPVGTTITWTNDDDIPHLVVEKEGAFSSEALDTGDSYSWQATAVGTVEYYCALHPHMTGKIIVTQ
jgi:plastocyanin